MITRFLLHSLIAALVSTVILPPATSDTRVGAAAHYGAGVMERVADARELPRVRCMVSSPFEGIGTWLQVTRVETGHTELYRVTDVSAPADRLRHIRRGLVIEFGWPAAQRFCGLRYVGQEPPWKCVVRVKRVSDASDT